MHKIQIKQFMAFEFKLDDFPFLVEIYFSAFVHMPENLTAPIQVALDELQDYRQKPSGGSFSFSDQTTLQKVLTHAAGTKSSFLSLDVKTKSRLIARNIDNPHYQLWRVPDEMKQKHGFHTSLPHNSPDEFVDLYEHFLFFLDSAETSIGNFYLIEDLSPNERITDLERGLHFFASALQTGTGCGATNLFELALTLVNKYRILIPGELKLFQNNAAYNNLRASIHRHYDAIKEGLSVLSVDSLADKLSPSVRRLLCEGISQYLTDLNPEWGNAFEEIQADMGDDQIIEAFDHLMSPGPALALQTVTEQMYAHNGPEAFLIITPFAPPSIGLHTLIQ
ncbi:MAG: hypothetical protein ACD_73C00148G0003 [uncultured bacterium]|nr:MAG: hypothetical protein ACD_73C00148G0003 [uncultured bacterium]